MANQDQIRKLLKEGVDAARAGDTAKAKNLFLQVTEMDETNERAWLWMATVADNDDEKRVYLGNVLYINPNNENAQKMLDQLEGKEQAAAAQDDEIAPGIPRGRVILFGGIAIAFYLVIMVSLFIIGSNRRANFRAEATQVAQAAANLAATQTEQLIAVTSTFEANETATVTAQQAMATFTPTTNPNRPTQVPTWTPTPEPTSFADTLATALPPPPAEVFSGGVIVGWGGRDRLNNGTFPVFRVSLSNPSEINEIGNVLVTSADLNPANGQEIIYTRWYTITSTFGLERANINGTQQQPVGLSWLNLEFILNQYQGQFSHDGSKLVFVGPADNTTQEIWLLDLDFPNSEARIQQITDDAADYSFPSLSTDGTRIAAVRVERNSLSPFEDVVVIDVASGSQTQLTSDGGTFIESYVRWIPNSDQVAVTISEGSAEAPGDIISLSASNPEAPASYLVRSPETNETAAAFSADGRYMAYGSDRSGIMNVFLREVGTETDFQVTNDTEFPRWPGGFFLPGIVEERPLTIIPSPVPLDDEGNPEGSIPPEIQATMDAATAAAGG